MLADLQSTDEYLYTQAKRRKMLILQFYKSMVEASIECSIMRDKLPKSRAAKIDCLMCAPTDNPLFKERLDQDLSAPNPCKKAHEKSLKAKELIVEMPNGTEKKYMYNVENGVKIFYEFNPSLKGWVIVPRNDPYFDLLMESISQKNTK